MYTSGTRKRPTIMTKIEEKEAELLRHIQFCIEDCEKITGRRFMFPVNFAFRANVI